MSTDSKKDAGLEGTGSNKDVDPAHASVPAETEDVEDPDFDDLDDVLDQFSANAPSATQTNSQTKMKPQDDTASSSQRLPSGPGRPPSDTIPAPETEMPAVPDGPRPGESEEDFIKRLTTELSNAMTTMSATAPEDTAKATPEELAKMGKELEEFTLAMEKEGIQPEDLLKAILGEEEGSKLAAAAHEDADKQAASAKSKSRTASPEASKTKATSPQPKADPASFEDTIRQTMERMETSSAAATSASQTSNSKSEEDMLADLLKTLSSGGGDGDPSNPDDLSAMFLNMMQQLTHKDMLYEPMKELDQKFPEWLEKNRTTIKADDQTRYEKQQVVVKEIVRKFEERGYSDDDTACKEYIWERMQKMQEQGAPPEDLISSPFPGAGGLPGLGGGGPEDGCPTQ